MLLLGGVAAVLWSRVGVVLVSSQVRAITTPFMQIKFCFNLPDLIYLNAMLLFSGGYYNIELAGRRLRLISLNMNIYLEDIADEFPYHERSSQGLLRSRHQQKTAEQRRRYNADNRVSAVKSNNFWKDEVRASRQLIKNEPSRVHVLSSMASTIGLYLSQSLTLTSN